MLKKYIEEVYYEKSRKILFGNYYELGGKIFFIVKYKLFKIYSVYFYNKPIEKGGKLLLNELIIRPKRYYYV